MSYKWYVVVFLLAINFTGCVTTPPTENQTDWYSKSQVRFAYQNGKLDGIFEFYNPQGQLQHKGQFKDNKKDGLWTVWESTGVKIAEITYDTGVLNGPITLWYGSYLENGIYAGKIKLEANFANGKYNGEYRTFTPIGKNRNAVLFQNGKPTRVILYDENGMRMAFNHSEAVKYANMDVENDMKLINTYDKVINDSIKYSRQTK